MIIAAVWHKGHKGRAPKKEEQQALAFLRSLDTLDHLVQLPCGIRLNGIDYVMKWVDEPADNLPDGVLDT